MNQRLHEWEKKFSSDLLSKYTINCYSRIPSTMDSAKDFLSAPSAVPGYRNQGLILAAEQSSGRGRLGREWKTSGSAFLGTFFSPAASADPGDYTGFSLAIGVAIIRVLANYTDQLRLKWPNDIYTVDGRKLSGTLIEFMKFRDQLYILAGIGINLSMPPSSENSVALFDISGVNLHPSDVAISLIEEFFSVKQRFEQTGFSAFKNEWLNNSYNLNSDLTVTYGKDKVTGVFEGVTEKGELILIVEGKRTVVV